MRLPTTIFTSLCLVLLLPAIVVADSGKYAEQLSSLRSEINNLEERLDEIRSETKYEKEALKAQEGDLELMLRKEKVRRATLSKLFARQNKEKEELEQWSQKLIEPAKYSAAELKKLIEYSIPFKKANRMHEVDEILNSLNSSQPNSVVAISRLWQLVEDEIKLATEIGLHRQAIELNGKRQLVETARISMALLYFRTEDGRYGWSIPDKSQKYHFKLLESQDEINAAQSLFEAMKKQMRKGYFKLPMYPLKEQEKEVNSNEK